MLLKIKRLRPEHDLPLPSYESTCASGMDLRADIYQGLVLKPGHRALVPTGFAVEIPTGYEAQIRPRSGLAIKNGVTLVNAPGTIDSDYRGEVSLILINHGLEDFTIKRGDRIAQMVIAPVTQVKIEEVQELSHTHRGKGGFGSTGL